MEGEYGKNPEKILPKLRFVHHETHMSYFVFHETHISWSRRETTAQLADPGSIPVQIGFPG